MSCKFLYFLFKKVFFSAVVYDKLTFGIELLINISVVINYQFVHALCFKNKNYLLPVFLKTLMTLEIQAEQR